MNIGFDAKRVFYNRTGLGNYSRTLLQNLLTNEPGANLSLFTPSIKKEDYSSFFIDHDRCQIFTSGKVAGSIWRQFGIPKLLDKKKIDIYHGLSNELPMGVKSSRAKTIVTIHDLIFKRFPATYSTIDRNIYDFKSRKSCELADVIIAASESTKNDIVQFYGVDAEKIKVVYQACSSAFDKLQTEDLVSNHLDELELPSVFGLCVGSVIERKNILTLVRAYEFIPEKERIPIVIVGSGKAYMQRVVKHIQEKKLEKWFLWKNSVGSQSILKSLYQAANFMVYPSVYEGFGIPVLEAMKMRTPVITANKSSLPEVGGKSAAYFEPTDHEELAHLILEIQGSEKIRNNMIEKGVAQAEKFSAKKTTLDLMEVYQSVL